MSETVLSDRAAVIEHLRKMVAGYHGAGKIDQAAMAEFTLGRVLSGAELTLVVRDDGGTRVMFK